MGDLSSGDDRELHPHRGSFTKEKRMTITFSILCLIAAVIVFGFATFNFPSGRFNLISLGLLLLSLALAASEINVDG